jgi:hypothetical protein
MARRDPKIAGKKAGKMLLPIRSVFFLDILGNNAVMFVSEIETRIRTIQRREKVNRRAISGGLETLGLLFDLSIVENDIATSLPPPPEQTISPKAPATRAQNRFTVARTLRPCKNGDQEVRSDAVPGSGNASIRAPPCSLARFISKILDL